MCGRWRGKAEIEVETSPYYRRCGLATVVSAALVLECLERGLEPCWDAANPASAGLARKLGLESVGCYNAYVIE